MFQVIYDKFTMPFRNETAKDNFLQVLKNSGIKYEVKKVEENATEKLWHCPKVVFDMNLIEAARKAIAENRRMDGLYTFGDPDEIAVKDSVVEAECTDGRLKNVYVVDIWLATSDEIKVFKAGLGYKHLGLIKRRI